jgi:hypothetical protein
MVGSSQESHSRTHSAPSLTGSAALVLSYHTMVSQRSPTPGIFHICSSWEGTTLSFNGRFRSPRTRSCLRKPAVKQGTSQMESGRRLEAGQGFDWFYLYQGGYHSNRRSITPSLLAFLSDSEKSARPTSRKAVPPVTDSRSAVQ